MAWKLRQLFSHGGGTVEPVASAQDAHEWFQRGNAQVAQQRWQPALECYRTAIALDAHHAEAHAYMGNVLRQLREPEAAMRAYDRAIAVKPDFAVVHYNRGALLQQARQLPAALESYDAALAADPSFTEAHCARGDVLRELSRLHEAMASYDAAIALQPDYVDAYLNLGRLQADVGNNIDALTSFDAAIAVAPGHAAAHAGRGVSLMELGQLEAALTSFDNAVRLEPESARAFGNRAQVEAKLGRLTASRASHDRAVSLDAQDAALHFNRGVFLSDRKEWNGAVQSYQAAIALRPDYAEAHCNLGLVRQETGQEDAALEGYSRALAINPGLATALNNRGNLFRGRKQFAESLRDYREVIALAPNCAEGHYNLGQLALLRGDFAAGWPAYEYRHLIEEALAILPRKLPQPAWFGEHSLEGKRIFLHAEQGLGDTIQFCRYASLVADLGAHVTLEVQLALGDLLANLEGVSQLTLAGSPIPPADYQCSLMSLPGAFKTTLETIPRLVPYLRADPLKVERWQQILGPRTRPRVGLAWRGNPRNSHDAKRRVPLSALIAHLPQDFQYVCLQNEILDEDREELRACSCITTVESHLKNFTDTAALVETLDLVVSVCTSLAHLSGALGRKTWVLLAYLPDWRWLLDRTDNPWYPSATLYRQPAANDWNSVLANVRKDLLSL